MLRQPLRRSLCVAARRIPKLGIQDAHEVAQRHGGKCLSEAYESNRLHLRWKCAAGHEWNANLKSVKDNGSWCSICFHESRRISIAEVRQLAESRGGMCLSMKYVNAKQQLRWRCTAGHEWFATLDGVKYGGSWCPQCSNTRKLSIEEAQDMAAARGGKCLSTTYVRVHDPMDWE